MSGGARGVKKTIQNIKEITGNNYSEDEIYAMLKECNMDPNETTQNLLAQDPFHEVRRKRDRKKENNIKESTEPKWKPGMPGRGNRGGRGNYSARHNSQGSGRSILSAKDNEINRGAGDGVILPAPQDKKNKEILVASSSNKSEVSTATASDKSEGSLPKVPSEANKITTAALSASDPILMPSQDSRPSVGTISREVGTRRTPVVEQSQETPAEIQTASDLEVGSSFVQGKVLYGEENNLVSPSTNVSSSSSRPSSSYNNRPQQAIGPQKVATVKEWKPKPTTLVPAQELGAEVPVIQAEVHSSSKPRSSIPESKESKEEKSHISDGQHVIIPNHLHVAEVEKLGFQFGSFDASFGFNLSSLNGPTSDKSPAPSEASEEIAEQIEEQTARNQDVLVTVEDGHDSDRPPSSSNVPQNLSPEGDISSNGAPENVEPKHKTSLPFPSHPFAVVHPSSNLNFGFIPPIIGSHVAPFETNDSRAPDSSRVPSFAVQQPFDPAGYYPQFYLSGADSDGRISPFHPPVVVTKYNGNVSAVSQHASQEVGDWVRVKASVSSPKYGWEDISRNSIGLIHSLEEDGDMGIAFCFSSKPFTCSITDVEKVPPFELGQEIHVMSSVTQPRLGWSNESSATVGKIVRIDMDGALNAKVAGRHGLWKVSLGDAEVLSGFEVGDWVCSKPSVGTRPSYDWYSIGKESLAVVHSVQDSGYLELACFRKGKWMTHHTDVEKVLGFKIGQHVRSRTGLVEPRWGWRDAQPDSRGVIISVNSNGEVRVGVFRYVRFVERRSYRFRDRTDI